MEFNAVNLENGVQAHRTSYQGMDILPLPDEPGSED